VLQEVAELAAVTFPKSISIETQLPGDLWPIEANVTQIHQVFLNLCINARDAMPQGGELTLTAANRTLDAAGAAGIPDARPGDFLAVEVRDTGTGIPPEVLARIWDPFYTTKGEGKGTGLGLSTVREILRQHDGFVTVQTRPDHGTAFMVYLPAIRNALGADALPDVAQPARGKAEVILVVDDEEPVRLMAAQILSSYGYRTITAGDGAEAIAAFVPRSGEVRLVLTDIDMPMLGGQALATALHRMRPGLPIVAMSGTDSEGNISYKAFATAFLAKPFQAETLLSLVRRALDEPTSPSIKIVARSDETNP
jgi:CheY-like chemotaxis protein